MRIQKDDRMLWGKKIEKFEKIVHSIQCDRQVNVSTSFNMLIDLNIGKELVVILSRGKSPFVAV